jgi:hypothetical protein
VSTGTTGHTEAVQLEYDPAEVSYKQLLDVFWKKHDPTQVNRQVCFRYFPVCIAEHVFNFLLFDVLPSPSIHVTFFLGFPLLLFLDVLIIRVSSPSFLIRASPAVLRM